MAKSTRSKPKAPEVEVDKIDEKAKADQEAADKAAAAAEAKETTDATKDEDNSADKNVDGESEANTEAAAEDKTDESDASEDTLDVEAEDVSDEVEEQAAPQTVADLDPRVHGNYLSQPKAIRDAEASQEQIHTPTGTRLTPPMNPFMKLEQERDLKRVHSSVPTAAEMATLIETELRVDTSAHFVLGSIAAKLNNYVSAMAPNTPVNEELGARWQGELAKCFFEALSAEPEASLVSLKIIELYFREYRAHTFARSHVFRFMDLVRLEQQRLTAFQSLLHLFVELGDKGDRTNKEIQREINIGKIAESISDNTDAQVRLVEFLN